MGTPYPGALEGIVAIARRDRGTKKAAERDAGAEPLELTDVSRPTTLF